MQNQKRMCLMMLVMYMGWISGFAWIGSVATGQSASQAASVPELLQRYTQALDATQSFTDTYQEESDFAYRMPGAAMKGRKFTRGKIRSDGKRLYHQDYSWGDIRPSTMNLPESTPEYHLRLVAEGKLYTHSTSITTPRMKGNVDMQSGDGYCKANITCHPYSGLYGYLGANERIDAVLRAAQQISMRPRTESVNGVACHVIDAHTKYGQYTVWLDPTHGYNAAKVTRKARAGNHKINEQLMLKGDHAEAYVVITRFDQVGGTWVPVEADQQTVYTSGSLFSNDYSHYQRANIVLNPDHDTLGSFDKPHEHPANDPELRNNARVNITDCESIGVKASWTDGKVLDESGQIIDLRKLWASPRETLLNASLPNLTDLSKDLALIQSSDKPLLVCLCDLQQRVSKDCLSDLSQKVSVLSARGFSVVVIQISKVHERHQAWLKNMRMHLPIHACECDFNIEKAAWAVKDLPWLILTDKEHVVTGEGLSVEEVEKMISR